MASSMLSAARGRRDSGGERPKRVSWPVEARRDSSTHRAGNRQCQRFQQPSASEPPNASQLAQAGTRRLRRWRRTTASSNAPSIASSCVSHVVESAAFGSFPRHRRSNRSRRSRAHQRIGARPSLDRSASDTCRQRERDIVAPTERPLARQHLVEHDTQTPTCPHAYQPGFPLACSGLIYAAVPMITPICVAAAVRVGD